MKRVEIAFANSEERPDETGKEVDMRVMLRGVGVVIAVAIICIAGNSTWAEGGELSKADRSALCEIFSRIVRPVPINVSSKTKPHIPPARIHRCQTAEFRVVGPDASTVLITIYDSHIVFADDYQQDPNHDGKFDEYLVTRVSPDHPVRIAIPADYPHPSDPWADVSVVYHARCFDAETGESYDAQGGSPPHIIIPSAP